MAAACPHALPAGAAPGSACPFAAAHAASKGSAALLLVAQAAALLGTFALAAARGALALPAALLARLLWRLRGCPAQGFEGAVFYEGEVYHSRTRPKENSFRYRVRMALVDLDAPPAWWRGRPRDHLSADEARALAGTAGAVRLLTNPAAAGYVVNPISVYYCYEGAAAGGGGGGGGPRGAALALCIAEVTNTPWGERVRFLFRPSGESVPKCLHVSPFMDMLATWRLRAPPPGDALHLSVAVTHPSLGAYFLATLDARLAASPHLPNELAGLAALLRYGLQPQRVALLIYWQALLLGLKGIPFYGPPPLGGGFRSEVERRAAAAGQPALAPAAGGGQPGGRGGQGGGRFRWRPARGWPWRAALAGA